MSIRKGDEVMVLTGDDAGKKGKVHRLMKEKGRLLVEGVNMEKRHMKHRANIRQAGIIERESPIHISNVMLVCTKCHKPTRVGSQTLDDRSRVRVCKRCNEVID